MKLSNLKVYIGENTSKSLDQSIVGVLRYKIDGVDCCMRTETAFKENPTKSWQTTKQSAITCVVHNLIVTLISQPLTHDEGFEFAALEYEPGVSA